MKKNIILEKSGEIFLKYGFKSVTMDDVAHQLAISKKTIYKYFKTKEKLVDNVITQMHAKMYNQVIEICKMNYNAIQENFEIKKMFKDLMNISGESPMFQLQKYYPEIYDKLITNEFSMFKECISANIQNGIKEGLYRKDLDVELMTKFYFSLIMSVHDSNLYVNTKQPLNKLEYEVLIYHTRAIATPEGIKILEEQVAKI